MIAQSDGAGKSPYFLRALRGLSRFLIFSRDRQLAGELHPYLGGLDFPPGLLI